MLTGKDAAPAAADEAQEAKKQEPLPKPLGQIVPPSVEDTATRLARLAREENTWDGARAALLRAMQLTREWERDHPHPHGE